MDNNNKKFISIIWWYHHQIFTFEKEQNYHIMPFDLMFEEWYKSEIFAIDSQVKIEKDPNFNKNITVIYYKNIFHYIFYLIQNRKNTIYSNTLTIRTLLVWIIWKNTVFYPHSFPFWHSRIKWFIIKFFYKFFTKIRINNNSESKDINKIKKWLASICPLVISNQFLNKNLDNRSWGVWVWNLTNIKNPEFLLETCKILKCKKINFNIKIIWEDRYYKNWKSFNNLIKENNLEDYINILWFLEHSGIKKYLSKSKIYINTSISEWQCLAVYEWALAWNILCLQNIMSFPSVFWNNAFYHNNPEELSNNIINILDNQDKYISTIELNQKMILEKYNYDFIKNILRKIFLNLKK